ncbi:MAG: hypothetical protein GY761_19955 [Hyphomicrobiales bacterium]|nr:hypothetical protein [Hyphomicrobiales bacterium]
MLEIDIVIVATRRLKLLEQMIESFSEKVFENFNVGKVLVNIDPIWGDEDDQTAIKKLLNRTFSDVTIFEPKVANFTKAVKRLWINTSADVVLHLEEDWIALEQIKSIEISENLKGEVTSISLMNSDKYWNGKQIYHYRRYKLFKLLFKIEDKSRPHFSTSPSFWSGKFLRECALYMDIKYDPEKQFYEDLNKTLQNFVSEKKCKFLIGHPDTVQDIGRPWREKRNIKKIFVDGASRWITTGTSA